MLGCAGPAGSFDAAWMSQQCPCHSDVLQLGSGAGQGRSESQAWRCWRKKAPPSMGRGRGGEADEPPWEERERHCKISMGYSPCVFATEPDYQQRRAGSRFRYRRRRRSGTSSEQGWGDSGSWHVSTLEWIAFLATVLAFCYFNTPARGSATCLVTRITATESMYLLITASSVSADGALRCGTSAIILEATGSGDAPNATSLGRFSIGAGMHIVPRTSASTQIYTSTHRMRHHEQPTSLDLHQQLYLLDAALPIIASSRPHVRLHRTASSSLPASLRPAAPSACRPTCPGRLAWTRRLLGRTAQRLHASKPCHAGFHGTPQKYGTSWEVYGQGPKKTDARR
jgi:hypothetical protein